MDYRNADGSVAEMCGNGIRVFVAVPAGAAAGSRLRGRAAGWRVGTRAGVSPGPAPGTGRPARRRSRPVAGRAARAPRDAMVTVPLPGRARAAAGSGRRGGQPARGGRAGGHRPAGRGRPRVPRRWSTRPRPTAPTSSWSSPERPVDGSAGIADAGARARGGGDPLLRDRRGGGRPGDPGLGRGRRARTRWRVRRARRPVCGSTRGRDRLSGLSVELAGPAVLVADGMLDRPAGRSAAARRRTAGGGRPR